jgi:hypothetical protein
MRDLDHPILASAENTNIVHLQYQVVGHRAITSKEGPQEGEITVFFVVHKTTSELERVIFTTLFLPV